MSAIRLMCMLGISAGLFATSTIAAPIGTAFTYQGRLENPPGTAVDDTCDFRVGLWDAATLGNQKGTSPQTIVGVAVVDGIFSLGPPSTAALDFGAGAINGQARWREIEVKCTGDAGFVLLAPRVEITPAPHALALPGLRTPETASVPNVIGGGTENTMGAGVEGGTIAGGGIIIPGIQGNLITDDGGFIGGGSDNEAGRLAMVGGGSGNLASGSWSSVGGADTNQATGNGSIVAGGTQNLASNDESMVGGGVMNHASGFSSVVVGGSQNEASAGFSMVGGGQENHAWDGHSTVGGGHLNWAYGPLTTVGGGHDNDAIGPYSFIGGGSGNEAGGSYSSICGGFGNHAAGYDSSVGGGFENDAFGARSTIGGGRTNIASGEFSTIGGGNSHIAGGEFSAIGGGYQNYSFGAYSTSPGGSENRAHGDYSFASGRRAKVRNAFAAGEDDAICGPLGTCGDEGAFVWADSTDADFTSTGPNQFLIRAAGGVGINTNSPSATLDVVGSSELNGTLSVDTITLVVDATNNRVGVGTAAPTSAVEIAAQDGLAITGFQPFMTLRDTNASNARTRISNAGGAFNFFPESYIGGNAAVVITNTTGRVGIGDTAPSVALDVVGDINYTGSIVDVSDGRLKEDIRPVDCALDKVAQLRGVTFAMKGSSAPREAGLIAQDVQTVLPEAVRIVDEAEGHLGVSYPAVTSLLVEAVKEVADHDERFNVDLHRIVEEKDCQIQSLDTEISNLKLPIDELKSLVRALADQNEAGVQP